MDQNDSFQSRQQPSNELSTLLNSSFSIKPEQRADILKSQYTIAVDLYKHEDNLNWNKLYNLFYVTLALLLILSSTSKSIETFPNDISHSMLGVISVVGILISLSFAIVIWSGVIYLSARKKKVVKIEQKLEDLGGISIVGGVGASQHEQHILKVSPTTIILKFIPFAFAFGWFILLCYSIVQLFK